MSGVAAPSILGLAGEARARLLGVSSASAVLFDASPLDMAPIGYDSDSASEVDAAPTACEASSGCSTELIIYEPRRISASALLSRSAA